MKSRQKPKSATSLPSCRLPAVLPVPASPEPSSELDADKVKLTAVEYCLFHYPTLFTGGVPHRSPTEPSADWVVPIVLTHPDYGVVGPVGVLRIHGGTGNVIASTPRSKVVAAGLRLQDKFEAAQRDLRHWCVVCRSR